MSLFNTITQTVKTADDFGYFPSTCQLRTATAPQDDYGDPIEDWDDEGDPIKCRVEPRGDVSTEVRRADGTVALDARYIKLDHYVPAATREMQAVADGVTWNVLDVDNDAQHTRTRLIVERVT